MDSLDLCLPKALAELNLLEQYKLNTLVHKWHDVVGDVIADHTKNCFHQASKYGYQCR